MTKQQIAFLADAIRSDLPPECRAATMGDCLAARKDAHARAALRSALHTLNS